jgi:hypothetical protein
MDLAWLDVAGAPGRSGEPSRTTKCRSARGTYSGPCWFETGEAALNFSTEGCWAATNRRCQHFLNREFAL